VVAEILRLGDILGWPELVVVTFPDRPDRPFMTIKAGQANWRKALEFPPPGLLEAMLAAAKAKLDEVMPF
jgi:hypothetical protein